VGKRVGLGTREGSGDLWVPVVSANSRHAVAIRSMTVLHIKIVSEFGCARWRPCLEFGKSGLRSRSRAYSKTESKDSHQHLAWFELIEARGQVQSIK